MRSTNVLATLLIFCLATCSLSPAKGAETATRTGTHIERAGVEVVLAAAGKANFPVVTAATATARTQASAEALARLLSRITGAQFRTGTGNGTTGIALGLPGDFPKLKPAGRWGDPKITELESYSLQTHANGLRVLGATELAVENGVWDVMHRLGYRQFFPGETWEVVPRIVKLSVALDVEEAPDYLARRIWYGYGLWGYNQAPYQDWCAKNRTVGGVALSTGHAYGGIIRALRTDFEAHPEFYALLDGKRKIARQAKFCISNADLRQRVAQYAVAQFDHKPELQSISMDPSDGGGWCECPACEAMGSVSDRALLLANQVARAVNAKHLGRLVGMYAYGYHSPPPTIRVEPQVVVSVATAFLKGGYTLDEIIAGWSGKGATLGIREYYSVNTWDRDLPGHSRGTKLDYLAETIPKFHAQGARFLSAESGDSWAPNGLGYYLAARVLWDVDKAREKEQIVEDFLTRAFGAAKAPMAEFYAQIDGSRPHLVATDQLARMFRPLAKARELGGSPAVGKRLDHLLLYARYVDLYQRYAGARGEQRQRAFEQLIRHAYRMRETMMVHSKALYRDLVNRDRTVSIPDGATWKSPEETNPWKSSAPFTAAEFATFLAEGIERYQPTALAIQPVKYSERLVPVTGLALPATGSPGELGPGRNKQTFYTISRLARTSLQLQVTGGFIPHYRDRGNVRVQLWKIGGESATGERETLIQTDRSVPPDGKERAVLLSMPSIGLYRIDVSDGGDRTLVTWPAGQAMAVRSTVDEPMNAHYGSWMMHFYVPKGTKMIGFHGGSHGEIHDSAGRPVFWLNGRQPDYYTVAVPEGQDGTFWRVRYGRGPIRLLNVPPYFARTPEELLLPKEVVDADSKPE